MKKHTWLAVMTALILMFGCIGVVHAEVKQPLGPGQQIGYPAVVLCESLTLREKPDSSDPEIRRAGHCSERRYETRGKKRERICLLLSE